MKISKAIVAHVIAVPLVAVLTVGSAWLAKHFPGLPHLNNEEVAGAGLLLGTTAAGVALHYLKGLREWERLEGEGIIEVEGEAPEAPLTAEEIPTAPTGSEADAAIAALPAPTDAPAVEGGAPGGGE